MPRNRIDLGAFRGRRGLDPRITAEQLARMTYTDPADRNWRDRQTNRFNAMRLAGYPVAGSFERQGAYDPSQGTVGGMRMPGSMERRPTSVSFGGGGGLPGTVGGGATIQGGGKGLPGSLAAGAPQGARPTHLPTYTQSQPGYGGTAPSAVLPGGGATYSRSAQPDYGFTGQYDPFFDLVETIPELANQQMSIVNRGVLGEEGIQRLVETGIDPARERTKALTGDVLGSIRQAESQKATALARSMGGRFSGQPGRSAQAIAESIITPSLARQAETAARLQTQEMVTLNQLDAREAGLYEQNMKSKLIGLQGLGMTIDQGANIIGRRLFDPTVTNFGFTPERQGEVQSMLNKEAAAWGIEADKMRTFWNAFYQGELMKLAEELGGWSDYLDAFMPDQISVFGGGG